MARLILIPTRVVKHGELHRLLTAAWVHGDTGHLLMNMLSLYFFAGYVERSLGTVPFLVLYVACAVLGFVPTVLRHRSDLRYRSLGASGAVAGVIFSAILINPSIRMYLMFIPIPVPGWLFAVAYLAYSVYSSKRGQDGINHDAHFAGAVAGAGLTFLFSPELVTAGIRDLLS